VLRTCDAHITSMFAEFRNRTCRIRRRKEVPAILSFCLSLLEAQSDARIASDSIAVL
jgi:hypothetical protein